MTKISVFLDSFLCAATEDTTGGDDFYIAGAIVSNGAKPHIQAVLTKPVHVHHDQDKRFGVGGGRVFEADVDSRTWIKIALSAYDEDAAKDWDNYKGIVNKLGDGLAVLLPLVGASGATALVKPVEKIVGEIMKSDKDDHLGDITADLQLGQLDLALNRRVGVIEGSHLGSHYRYMVGYSILVGDTMPKQSDIFLVKIAHSGKVLDVYHAEHRDGAALIQHSQNGNANQRFALEPVGGGYYRIVAQHSGKCLTVKDGSRDAGAPIEQWTYTGGGHQQWKIERQPAGGTVDVRFKNKASDLYMSVRGGSEHKEDYAKLEIAKRGTTTDQEDSQSRHQLFRLLAV